MNNSSVNSESPKHVAMARFTVRGSESVLASIQTLNIHAGYPEEVLALALFSVLNELSITESPLDCQNLLQLVRQRAAGLPVALYVRLYGHYLLLPSGLKVSLSESAAQGYGSDHSSGGYSR